MTPGVTPRILLTRGLGLSFEGLAISASDFLTNSILTSLGLTGRYAGFGLGCSILGTLGFTFGATLILRTL